MSLSALAAVLSINGPTARAGDPSSVVPPHPVSEAPPPATKESRADAPRPLRDGPLPAGPETLYSIGQPTDDEQLYLELLNRTRLNPAAEAARLAASTQASLVGAYNFFHVDLALMQLAISAIPATPPLAFNEKLINAARGHNQWMFDHMTQSHNEGAVTPSQRVTAAGYTWQTTGENIYAYAKGVEHGHAGFEVDWGNCDICLGGMQTPPGHRENNHTAAFREVGIGALNASNGPVGPQLVTLDFAAPFAPKPLITGVAFYDLNGNGFYDLGEGMGGIQVNVTGAANYALTSESGGYAVPTLNGARTVTFGGPTLPATTRNVAVANGENLKVDLALPYQPPVVSGPATAAVNADNAYSFSAVGGASSYEWRLVQRAAATAVEGAEQGLADVTTDHSPDYEVIVQDVKNSGTAAFHLTTPDGKSQSITLNGRFRPGPTAKLNFEIFLGWASVAQAARTQVSADEGTSWNDLFTHQGTDSPGDSGFQSQSIALATYAGKEVQVRFVYDVAPGESYFPQTDPGVGLYLDDISFTDTERLTEKGLTEIASGTSLTFHPASAGDFGITVRPKVSQRYFPYGPLLLVSAKSVAGTVLRLSPPVIGPNGKVRVDFQVVAGSPTVFTIERTANPASGWATVNGLTLSNNGGGSYSFKGDSLLDRGFYRVRAQ